MLLDPSLKKDKLKVAIIGTGFGSLVHFPAFYQHASFDPVIIVGQNEERTKRIAGGKHDKLMIGGFTVRRFLAGIIRAALPLRRSLQIMSLKNIGLIGKMKIFTVLVYVGIIETSERVTLQFFNGVSQRS